MRLTFSAILLLLLAAPLLSTQDKSATPDIDHPLHVCGSPDTLKGEPCATAPRPITFTEPEYTDKARRAKLQGKIVLQIVVDTDGNVAKVKVVQGLGMGLDESALKTVRKWKFKPGTYEGNPVPVTVPLEVTFRIR